MYFANYHLISKNKYILKEPLTLQLQKRKLTFTKKLLKNLFNFQDEIYNSIIENYEHERQYILNSLEIIKKELNDINYDIMYSLEHSLDNYLIDYVRDNFDINKIGKTNESEHLNRLKNFIYLNELLFYIETDLVILAKKNNIIWIKSKAKYKQAYKRKWFAKLWESESEKSTLALLTYMNIFLPKQEIHIAVEEFSKSILDKIFFIHTDYISDKNKSNLDFQYINQLCRFFAFLYLTKHNKISLDDKILDELGFKDNNFLNELMIHQKKLNLLDQGFKVTNNNIILNTKNHIQNSLKNSLFQKYQNIQNLSSQFGKIFENYVLNYSIENFSKDYDVITNNINLDGLYYNNNQKLDIDMTLYDKKRDFYYFTQIKYTFIHKSYLKDELKHIGHRTTINKAKEQLENIPKFIKNKDFQKKLLKNNIKIKNNNYALIIIHTTPQYDFQCIDNIQLYEWNNFRNLLARGNQDIGRIKYKDIKPYNIQDNETLDLSDVNKAVQTSIRNNPLNIESEWKKFYREYASFEINNQKYLSNIK